MTRDQGFRTGNVEYKFHPRLRLQLGLSMRRGERALVLQSAQSLVQLYTCPYPSSSQTGTPGSL